MESESPASKDGTLEAAVATLPAAAAPALRARRPSKGRAMDGLPASAVVVEGLIRRRRLLFGSLVVEETDSAE